MKKLGLALVLLSSLTLFGAQKSTFNYNKPPKKGCYKPKGKPCPGTVGMVWLCPDDPKAPLAKTYPCNAYLDIKEGK